MVKPSLELRHNQSLVMTEQLQQSIKLLQLSAIELTEFIDQELEKNPLLTIDEPTPDAADPHEDDGVPASENDERVELNDSGDLFEPEAPADGLYTHSLDMQQEGSNERASGDLDTNNEDVWGGGDTEGESLRYSGVSDFHDEGGGGSFSDAIEQRLTSKPDLKTHLLEQMQVDIADPAQRIIARHLIDILDEVGYLREKTTIISEQLGATQEEVEDVILLLQRCDPPGVFARSLKECLDLQLEDRGLLDEPMEVLLDNLQLLAEGDVKKLRKLCGVEEDELSQMLVTLRTLDPHPGSNFSVETAETLIPDVYIKKVAREGWKVELNADVLPKLIVNRQYYTLLTSQSRRKDDKKFLSEQLTNANWLIKSLDQRAQTMLKVSTEILRQQEEFFEYGIHFLKPMTLRHIAEAISVHESTVSRVTTGKYMATPRGVFEMKYFFSSSLHDAGTGDSFSSRTVMHMIKELVEQEKAGAILSDDSIAEILQGRGVEVARRTIVKYRQNMGIPSSVDRRREKRMRQSIPA